VVIVMELDKKQFSTIVNFNKPDTNDVKVLSNSASAGNIFVIFLANELAG
jgi:hypothetical protein